MNVVGSLPAAQTGDPIPGTWKFRGPRRIVQTRTGRQTADGVFVTIDTIDSSGNRRVPIGIPGKHDGKDYPMTGSTSPAPSR
jgi:hypothetical protein